MIDRWGWKTEVCSAFLPPPTLSFLLLSTITDGFRCSLINVEKEKEKTRFIASVWPELSARCVPFAALCNQ